MKNKQGSRAVFDAAARASAATLLALVFIFPTRAFAQCAGCPNASFGPAARSYEMPGSPIAFVVADLNGDGILDLAAVSSYSSYTVSVFLGDGRGHFGARTDYPSGTYNAQSIAAGDFDGDGNVDLVVSDGSQTLYLLRGAGSGLFLPASPVPITRAVTSLLTGDFNGDGLLDLAAAEQSGNYVTFLFGNGAGGFHPGILMPAGPGASVLRVADFNGDGLDDLLVANNAGNSVTLILGVRIGPFAPGHNIDVLSRPTALAVADFNLDGKPDFAVAAGGVRMFLGKGDGTFEGFSGVHNLDTIGLLSGDFNGDGKPDLVSVRYSNTYPFVPSLFFSFGDGAGAFPTSQPGGTGMAPGFAVDLDRDGVTDLVGMNGSGLFVSLGTGGSAVPAATVLNTSYYTSKFVAGDLNGDGRADVVLSSDYGFPSLAVLLTNASGGFDPPVPLTSSAGTVTALALADVNGDGKLDLLVAKTGNIVTVHLGTGSGSFGTGLDIATGATASAMAIADLNGDGRPDLILVSSGGNSLSVLKGRGDGTFQAPVQYAAGASPTSLAVADFNRDGKLDVATGNAGADNVTILLGDGSGGFNSLSVVTIGLQPTSLVAGDFTGDGKVDLAAITGQYSSHAVTLLPGDGAGGFGPPTSLSVSSGAAALAVADFNGNGVQDLALAGAGASSTGVLMSNGLGGFRPMVAFHMGGAPSALAVADFDGDGRPDLAALESNPSLLTILRNTSCRVRRLGIQTDVSSCDVPGAPFASQPVVAVYDDGDNVVACDTGMVSASLLPGSGTPGAALGGTTSVNAAGGIAPFTNLSVDLPGLSYGLRFSHALAGSTRSRPFSQGLSAAIAGPPGLCVGASGVYDGGGGYDTYQWMLDGNPAGGARQVILSGLALGSHVLSLAVSSQGCLASASLTVTVSVPPSAAVSAPAAVCPDASGVAASVPDAGPGATYAWTIGNGVILTGAGTHSITFKAGPSGQVSLSVTVTNGQGCAAAGTKTVSVDRTLSCPSPVGFFTVAPCRVLDTRSSVGPYGGPSLGAHGERVFVVSGQCGIPADATAVSINVVAVGPTDGPGFLTVYPAGTARTSISTINYKALQTRANNGIVGLGAAGDLAIYCGQGTGTADVVLDINGYLK